MKVLLDECLPRKLKQHFRQHDCQSVTDLGWSGKKNGELLSLAEMSNVEVFITVDQGIEYLQNIAEKKLGIVLLQTGSSRYSDLIRYIPEVLQAISMVAPGKLIRIPSR